MIAITSKKYFQILLQRFKILYYLPIHDDTDLGFGLYNFRLTRVEIETFLLLYATNYKGYSTLYTENKDFVQN